MLLETVSMVILIHFITNSKARVSISIQILIFDTEGNSSEIQQKVVLYF